MTDMQDHAARVEGYRRDLLMTEIATRLAVVTESDAPDVCALLCGWLEEAAAGIPDPAHLMGSLRADAAFWADIATPFELEAYVAAGLARIERTHFAQGARKRLFVAFWEGMTDADRRRFLARVDPDGRFKGAAA